ncbi:MAG TPA: orotidine 5'-phosphate decarboxylase / HUMPS family protein [Candidatus Binataceae bacterium]|nr:orotidine 5'-phosphate decarboxylase / HUMPS family protein [Candidatus Binataceae bacterium]
MGQYWPLMGLIRHGTVRDRLIVPLDHLDRGTALRVVEQLARTVGMFKIGRSLFSGGGPELVREVRKHGGEVFLDLRFRDSPQGALRAVVEATRLGVKMFDLQACRGTRFIERVKVEVSRICRIEALRRPHIIGVAMLAGLNAHRSNLGSAIAGDSVAQLALAAAGAGLDGVFTPAGETAQVRAACGRRFIVVTCGVRPVDELHPGGFAQSAAEVIRAGADYVVLGAPVSQAAEPVQAIAELTHAIEERLKAGPRAAPQTLPARDPRPRPSA